MCKMIKPEGIELVKYLNNGDAICNKCGALMEREEDPMGGCDILICPACGEKVDEMDYEYDHDGERWVSKVLSVYGGDVPPAGCRACGGPYPNCVLSCKLFDD